MSDNRSDRPELLAPAGGPDAAFAALQYGADAIYCGLSRFSARADAENLTLAALDEIVGYAHSLTPRRRVYAAVNTLILDRERGDAVSMLHDLADIGVDAVIVQDAGVAAIVKRFMPGMRLHASTQMAVHNIEGAKALRAFGFARAVVARELSVEEVRGIAASSGIEIETFVHGALCYSYSGLCLFSSHTMGRSGNRGRCAYCCREEFGGDVCKDAALPFSMKDLAMGSRLDDLAGAGVAGLKIEGRMKSALYVASVTGYYRRLIDGELRDPAAKERLEEDLRTVFSRPWTTLYAGGAAGGAVVDASNVGHRGARIGVVESVRRDRAGRWLTFTTARAIEKHDGIQVDLPRQARPFGFAVDALRREQSPGGQGNPQVVSVPAGARISVMLPGDAPELPEGAPVYCASSQAVKRGYPVQRPRPGVFRQRRRIGVTVEIAAGHLHAVARDEECADVRAEVSLAGPFDAARQADRTQEAFRQAFERTGDTEWAVRTVEVRDPEGRFVPVSQIHNLRRELCAALSARRAAWRESRLGAAMAELDAAETGPRTAAGPVWSVRAANPDVLFALSASDPAPSEVVWHIDPGLSAEAFTAGLGRLSALCRTNALRIALPPVVRAADAEPLRHLLRMAIDLGLAKAEIGNVGGLQFLADVAGPGWPRLLHVTADWPLYATNRQAAARWIEAGVRRVTLSPEDEGGNVETLVRVLGPRAAVIVCQYTPLFISETPPSCGSGECSDGLRIKGRSGQTFAVRRDGRLYVTTDSRPFCIADRLPALEEAGVAHLRVDLSYARQDPAEAVALWRTVRAGRCPAGSHAANFRRGLM